jgi:hypothetical protein
MRSDWVVATVGTAVAVCLAYWYVANNSLQIDWAQIRLSPAVNYACTGTFGPVRLGPDATSADQAALDRLAQFLRVKQLDFPCGSFPRHLSPTSFFDGIHTANAEQPLYLILLYAVLWRWFGAQWTVTYYVIAATVAASFVLMYVCARRFTPPLIAAPAALLFLSSPFFITNVLSPRDALKFPFAVAIGALLIAGGTARRRPRRFIAFAGLTGLLVGIGYGFRSDLLFLLAPAALICCFLGRLDLTDMKAGVAGKLASNFGIRMAAAGALLSSFAIGGWMPLINDHYLHDHYGDVGYHAMTMGLLGHTRYDLYQSDSLVDGTYMFRNAYNNDLSVGVRVMEFADRGFGEKIDFAAGPYWIYAKRYYLRIAGLIPADLVSGGIGAFVNLMTVPRSFLDRQSQVWRYDRAAPWTTAYSFVDGKSPVAAVLRLVDRAYAQSVGLSADSWFVANLIVLFLFLCLIAAQFGFRAAIASVIVLCAALMVTSLKFEMRHIFYVFSFTALTWTSVLWLAVRALWAPMASVRRRLAPAAADLGWVAARVRPAVLSTASVAILLIAAAAGVYAVLLAARAHQVDALRALVADWSARPRIPARFQVSELASGQSLIRILSPMPLSTGGERAVDSPVRPVVELATVVVIFDAEKCADRRIILSSVGDSDVPLPNTTYLIREIFSVTLRGGGDYMAVLPAFHYGLPARGKMIYSGIELKREDVSCVKEVSLVTAFKASDVLFDFFIAADPAKVRPDELFQRVYLPRLGFV